MSSILERPPEEEAFKEAVFSVAGYVVAGDKLPELIQEMNEPS